MKNIVLIVITTLIVNISFAQIGFLGYNLLDKKDISDTTKILNSLVIDTTASLIFQTNQKKMALMPFVNVNMNVLKLQDTLFGLDGELSVSYTERIRVFYIDFYHEFAEKLSKKKINKVISQYLNSFENIK